MINGVDVSDMNRNFTANYWIILGWNSGRAYVSHEREHMISRGCGGQGGVHDGGRGYGREGGPQNSN